MKTNKDLDAVEMMRNIRDKHQKEFELNPELREKRLAAIHKKFAHKIEKSEKSHVNGKSGAPDQFQPE